MASLPWPVVAVDRLILFVSWVGVFVTLYYAFNDSGLYQVAAGIAVVVIALVVRIFLRVQVEQVEHTNTNKAAEIEHDQPQYHPDLDDAEGRALFEEINAGLEGLRTQAYLQSP